MYIRTKYHPATWSKGARISVSIHEGFDDRIIARSYISMGEFQGLTSFSEEVLYCLEIFFERQRKAKNPLFMGSNPIDAGWHWMSVQISTYDFIFLDECRVTSAAIVSALRNRIKHDIRPLKGK